MLSGERLVAEGERRCPLCGEALPSWLTMKSHQRSKTCIPNASAAVRHAVAHRRTATAIARGYRRDDPTLAKVETLSGEAVPCTNFKYLGTILSNNGQVSTEVRRRVGLGYGALEKCKEI